MAEPALVEPPFADAAPADEALTARLVDVAAELRARITAVVHALAGVPPRPVRLMRRIGLDKSLASRLVQATRVDTDQQFLHAAPSPTGLRILLDRASAHADGPADPALLQAAAAAVDRFETLLDTLPGGRQALDALLGATSAAIRRKREQVARQASFKAQSFLFGHYCDTLATAVFVVPSASAPGKVDLVELHRRLGLQRLVASVPVPLMSLLTIGADMQEPDAPCVAALNGDETTRRPEDFLLPSASSAPLPPLRVVNEGSMVTFVLEPAPASSTLQRLSSALRVQRVCPVAMDEPYFVARRYMLHTPCRVLVRDVFLAESLWPGAQLHVDFHLPGPSGSPAVKLEPGRPHHRQVNLTCHIEQLMPGAGDPDLPDVADHADALREVQARAGLQGLRFRGWRCTMSYPVPLVEMQLAFVFAA